MGIYVRKFTNTETGEVVRGILQGNGGTAVPMLAIQREIQRMKDGRVGPPRFYEPREGYVRIYVSDGVERTHDDPSGLVEFPLATLSVSFADEKED